MLTRRIDSALDAIARCRAQVPMLSSLFRPGAPERAALDDLLDALRRTDDALLGRALFQAADRAEDVCGPRPSTGETHRNQP
jgi:hypothetical protein